MEQSSIDAIKSRQIGAQLEIAKQQNDVNKIEAADPSLFKSGWRPFSGWCCGMGLAYQFLALPLLSWLAVAKGWPIPPPLDVELLMTLLFGMLGLGSLRTVERIKGKA